jgi:hypothetical protein
MWFGGLPWTLNELVSAETIAVDRSVGEDGYHKLTLQGRAFARRPGTRRARARLHSNHKDKSASTIVVHMAPKQVIEDEV